MADETGKYIGDAEYGRLVYGGTYLGDMESGRVPAAGYRVRYVLTVQSSGAAAVSITVSPTDINGAGNGTTNFSRTYEPGTSVTLTAPATSGGYNFDRWTIDGVSQGATNPISVTMSADHTVIVYYVAAPAATTILGIEMLKVYLPKYKYWETDYPNLENGAEGKPIPEAWGDLHGIKPVCIDTATGKYKIARATSSRKLKAIDAVYADGAALTLTSDYTVDLTNGEFTIEPTPVLQANTTYYIIFESDISIDGTNYLTFAQNLDGAYADGTLYYIDGSGTWSDQSKDLFFIVYARTEIGGDEFALVDYWSKSMTGQWTGNWNMGCELRKTAAGTKIAQSFKTPATGGPWYLSRIYVTAGVAGSPSASRISRAYIVSAYSPAEVRVGAKSYRIEDYAAQDVGAPYPQRGEASDIRCDIKGYCKSDGTTLIDTVADWLYDVYVNLLGGSTAGLNATDLAALATARTEKIALYLAEEKQFEELRDLAEASALFKMIPSMAGDYALKYYSSGEPAGTPNLHQHMIKNFQMRRVWKNVYQRVTAKYDPDLVSGDFKVIEEISNIAQYVYNNQETLELMTILKLAADNEQLAEDYLGTDALSSRRLHYQYPTREAEFDVLAGYAWDRIPTDKVKLYYPRADYPGGSLIGVLFRILEVSKGQGGTAHIKAVLDSLTY